MSKFSNWSHENLAKFAQEATDKMLKQKRTSTDAQDGPLADWRTAYCEAVARHNETLDELRAVEATLQRIADLSQRWGNG
jgi:hypothetical protein